MLSLNSHIGNFRNILSGVILAGGENKRFPILKSLLKINGVPLIERNLELLGNICSEVIINTNFPELYSGYKHIMCGDVLPSRGPMSGIHSALLNSGNDNLFVIACDMPFLNLDILAYVCKRHFTSLASGMYDATIPIYNGKLQPLCGIYRKTILSSLERHILERKNTMHRYLGEINVNFIGEGEIRELDSCGNSFANINTINDYETLRGVKGEFILTI